ncbi:dihydrofolate reductase family protein [Flavobacterium sp. ARAG 55.4]|uniref:dihydrofolate reductase family protein n=1 Tax=Flavobacterium sp. ARAG 55.4 TaxID=3451357 RepID=UPI003F46F38C
MVSKCLIHWLIHIFKVCSNPNGSSLSTRNFPYTRTERPDNGRIKFYTGNIKDLVTQLKSEAGKDIYCDGGAEVVNELLKCDLINELTISVVPILLGNGTRLFKEGRPEQLLEFISAKTFDTGLVQVYYKRKK